MCNVNLHEDTVRVVGASFNLGKGWSMGEQSIANLHRKESEMKTLENSPKNSGAHPIQFQTKNSGPSR